MAAPTPLIGVMSDVKPVRIAAKVDVGKRQALHRHLETVDGVHRRQHSARQRRSAALAVSGVTTSIVAMPFMSVMNSRIFGATRTEDGVGVCQRRYDESY
jgi:hypothetical protein